MNPSSVPDPRVVEVLPARVREGGPDGRDRRAGDRPGGDTRGGGPRATAVTGEVGAFPRGDAGSRWALARYLVARTLGDSAVRSVLAVAVVFAVLTVVLALVSAPVVLTVLVGIVTVGWFVAWRLARALWRRLTAGPALDAVRPDLEALVGETRPDVRRELRRVGLPAHPFAAVAFAWRLRRAHRADTTGRMRRFEVERVVPADRVDRLYLLLERIAPSPR